MCMCALACACVCVCVIAVTRQDVEKSAVHVARAPERSTDGPQRGGMKERQTGGEGSRSRRRKTLEGKWIKMRLKQQRDSEILERTAAAVLVLLRKQGRQTRSHDAKSPSTSWVSGSVGGRNILQHSGQASWMRASMWACLTDPAPVQNKLILARPSMSHIHQISERSVRYVIETATRFKAAGRMFWILHLSILQFTVCAYIWYTHKVLMLILSHVIRLNDIEIVLSTHLFAFEIWIYILLHPLQKWTTHLCGGVCVSECGRVWTCVRGHVHVCFSECIMFPSAMQHDDWKELNQD